MSPLQQLVAMTTELADPRHGQVILGEGNTSCKDGETLWIKATGHQMPGIDESGFVQVHLEKVVQSLDSQKVSDPELRTLLNEARTDPAGANFPSTEAFMHAWLLTLPDVRFVAHSHPTTTLGVLCGGDAESFARERLFPDQIVLCGPESVYVPYCAPGFDLALAIRTHCAAFMERTGLKPRTILLQNHGLIALGASPKEAMAACMMTEKAARVFATAKEPKFLTRDEVDHIHNWTDEHFRQSKIWND